MNDQLNALDLLRRLALGELTPEDANRWSKETGAALPYGRPAACRFDPTLDEHWTPLQAIAWIATRDVDAVRTVSEGFRQWWQELRAVTRPDGGRGWIRRTVGPARFAEAANESGGFYGARDELWHALRSGALQATGFKGLVPDHLTPGMEHLAEIKAARERSAIPAIEWDDLKFPGDPPNPSESRGTPDENSARACIRADDRYSDRPDRVRTNTGLVFTGVRLSRSGILKLWPPKTCARVRRGRGRPTSVRERVEDEMRADVAGGYDLAAAKRVEMEEKYRASAGVVTKARRRIIENLN